MAKVKMLNDKVFSQLVKELSAQGELIKAREKEKQALSDQFDKERAQFKSGKISEATLKSSIQKTNKEFVRIDKDIRAAVQKSSKLSSRIADTTRRVKPKVMRAKESGISLSSSTKKKKSSAKPKAKKAKAKAKPKAKAKKKVKAKPKAKPKAKAKSKAVTKKAVKKAKPKAKAKAKKKAAPQKAKK